MSTDASQPGRRNVPIPPRLLRFAREMRHEMTNAEKRIWGRVRDRRLSGFKFRRQVPVDGVITDFYCEEAKLVVELDGGQHKEPDEAEYDRLRDQALHRMGVAVLRFWDNDALKNTDPVLERILETLLARTTAAPSPPPSTEGRGSERPISPSPALNETALPPSPSGRGRG